MNWDDQSSLPVLYRQFQWTDRNKIALETIATCLYFAEKNGHFVVRGLLKPFCRTIFDQYPDIFEVFRCPEQLVTVLELIARPTELCLLNCEADGIRVLPGTLSCSEKEAELRQRPTAAERLLQPIARSPGPSRGTNEGPAGLPDSSRSSFKSFSVAFG